MSIEYNSNSQKNDQDYDLDIKDLWRVIRSYYKSIFPAGHLFFYTLFPTASIILYARITLTNSDITDRFHRLIIIALVAQLDRAPVS